MISRERAEFMIGRLEKELSYLQLRKSSIFKYGTGDLDSINSKIEQVKESLNEFKNELMNIRDDEYSHSVDNTVKDFHEQKEKYETISLWNRFIIGLQNKKINYQKIKGYSQGNKIGRK